MNLKPLFYLTSLWLVSASCPGETITFICNTPDKKEEHSITLDTEQKTVIQDGKLAVGVMMTGSEATYYLKNKKIKSTNKLDLSEDRLYVAIPRQPPDVGYDRATLACRRN
ncbi:hypothetical protein [Methylomagnum sp.]